MRPSTSILAAFLLCASPSYADYSGPALPGGSNTQLQYNNSGAFGGDSGFTTNGAGVEAISTSLALGGCTIGSNALCVKGTSNYSSTNNIALGTITTNIDAINITATWNASGMTFDAPIFVNITNTASSISSLLEDLEVNNSSVFSVRSDGRLTIGTGEAFSNLAGLYPNGSNILSSVNSTNSSYQPFEASRFGWSADQAQITSPTTATLHLGAADTTVAVNQTLGAQGCITTANCPGASQTIASGASTGNASSDLALQTTANSAGSTTQNSLVTAEILKGGSQAAGFVNRVTVGSLTIAAGQSGDLGQIKETDAAAAPGAGYAVLKWVAGPGTSCNLIAYAGTSATPVTIASTVGSGC